MEYLLILIVFFVIALFIHWKFRIVLYKSRKSAIINISFVFVTSLLWDLYATKSRHWVFPGDGLTGIYFFYLPIEELLFYLIMQYFVIVVYRLINDKLIK